ncbi:hypothetical protein SteCoe_31317 [Stentor coeruleus]|uniref:Uncharacterized protein n=1 Tax=Stentor coeruleus TaxID=5963 RepID=A0A1R2B1N9_9CILI|nr:hypothetical protein SteCoe_31317 [Stentor coeruleus]
MDYLHVQLFTAPSSIVKYVITDQQKLYLDVSGHVYRKIPVKIPTKVINISSYNSISIFATIDGVYTQGNDVFKQGLLGLQNKPSSKTPVRLEIKGVYIECSISSTHAGALSQDGRIYIWGNLIHIGINQKKPYELIIPDKSSPIQIHCAKTFTAVLVYPGLLYIYKGSIIPFYINELMDLSIIWISGNEQFIAMTTENNQVYVWNNNGKLVNLPLCEGHRIKSIACSWKGIIGICDGLDIAYIWTHCKNEKFIGRILDCEANLRVFSGWKIAALITVDKVSGSCDFTSESLCKTRNSIEEQIFSLPEMPYRNSITTSSSSTVTINKYLSSETLRIFQSLILSQFKQVFILIKISSLQFLSCKKISKALSSFYNRFYMYELQNSFLKLKIPYKILQKFTTSLQKIFNIKILKNVFVHIKSYNNYLNYIIYAINNFTISITRIQFNIKLKSLICIKNHQTSSVFLYKITQTLYSRLSEYFSIIKILYIEKCLEKFVRNLSLLEMMHNMYNKKCSLETLAEGPRKMKRAIISYDKLLMSVRRKKQKEIMIIRESLNSPRLIKRNSDFNGKNLSLNVGDQSLGSTERRLEYSLRLNQKLQKISMNKNAVKTCGRVEGKYRTDRISFMVRALYRPVYSIFMSFL